MGWCHARRGGRVGERVGGGCSGGVRIRLWIGAPGGRVVEKTKKDGRVEDKEEADFKVLRLPQRIQPISY